MTTNITLVVKPANIVLRGDGIKYNVQQWTSVDGGRSYWYAGIGKFCKDIKECKAYIQERRKLYDGIPVRIKLGKSIT